MQSANGNANAMAELIPAISNASTESEKLAMINEAAARGLNDLQAETDTTAGAMARSAGAFGDLQEKIGAILAPIYKVVYEGLAVFAETLQTAMGPALDMVGQKISGAGAFVSAFMETMKALGAVVGAVIQSTVAVVQSFVTAFFGGFSAVSDASTTTKDVIRSFAEGVIGFITKFEVVLTNLPAVAELMAAGVALRLEGLRADMQHAFTVAIPAYVEWFSDNFVNLATDAFNAYITIAQNWSKNVTDIIKRTWDFITSGFEGGLGGLASDIGDIAGRNLLDGFEAQTQALPEIAERQATSMEKLLANRMGQIGTDLAQEYQDKMTDRLAGLDAGAGSEFDIAAPDLSEIAKAGDQLGDNAGNQIADKIGSSVESVLQPINAVQSRLMTRADEETPAQREARRVTQQQLETQKQQAKTLDAMLAFLQERGFDTEQLSLALVN